jgi:hypothetical protein
MAPPTMSKGAAAGAKGGADGRSLAPPPSGHPSAGGIVPFQPPPGLATVTPLTPAALRALERNAAPRHPFAAGPDSLASFRTGEGGASVHPFTLSAPPANVPAFQPHGQFSTPLPSSGGAFAGGAQWSAPGFPSGGHHPFTQPAPSNPFPDARQQQWAHQQMKQQQQQEWAQQQYHTQQLQQVLAQQALAQQLQRQHLQAQQSAVQVWRPPVDYYTGVTMPGPAQSGWPAAAVPYFDPPYGVPVDPWGGSGYGEGFDYGKRPAEPLQQAAAEGWPSEGPAAPHHPKPSRAAQRRAERHAKHHDPHHHHGAAAAAVAVGAVAVGAVMLGGVAALTLV